MRRPLASIVPILAVLLAAPVAQAGFAPASEEVVSAKEVLPELATGPADSIVAWSERPVYPGPFLTKARWLGAAGELGPVIDLKPGGPAAFPAVAIGPPDRAFVAWRSSVDSEPSTLEGRWVNRDGTLGPLLTIATPSATIEPVDLHVVVDPAGVATVAWKNESQNTLSVRRVQPDGSLSELVPNLASGKGVLEVRLAATPSGGTVVIWTGFSIEKSYVAPDLSHGTAEVISTGNVAWPEIATDRAGNSLVAWRESGSEPFSVRGRLIDPGGAPIGKELIIDPNQEGFVGIRTTVAADGAGDFLVAWERQVDSVDQVFGRGVNLSGAFAGPAQHVSAGIEGEFSEPQPALLDSGIGIFGWKSLPPGAVDFSTLARTVDGGSTPTAPAQLLSDGGSIEADSAPAAGYATVLSDDGRVVTVRRFLEPPSCAPASAVLRSRKGVEIRLSCGGVGIESGAVVTAPRRGTVGPLDRTNLSFLYKPKPRIGGNDSLSYTVTSDGGSSPAATVTVRDRLEPLVKKVRLVRKGGAYKLKLKASEPVRFKVKAEGGGKAKSKRFSAKATIRLKGRFARRLTAGQRIRIKVAATDRAGNKSRAKKARI